MRERRFAAWMVGVVYLPFGLFNGFVAAALPQLLVERGVPLDRVATITFIALLPSVLSFLITPLLDCGLPRRVWAALLACATAACLFTAVTCLDVAAATEHGRVVLTIVMLCGCLTAQMYGSAIGGLVPNLVERSQLGTASMWLNIAYLGGLMGGTIMVRAVALLPRVGAASVGVVEILLPACMLLLAKSEEVRGRRVSEVLRGVLRDVAMVVRQRDYALGFLVFLVPSATFVALNYFGGMGVQFSASERVTSWTAGVGAAVLSSVGAAAGGFLVARYDRRWLFVGSGVLSAFATVGMAFGPHVWTVFLAGVSLYALLAGVNYVAATALAFELVGPGNPLSATLYAMLMSACNLAIEVMVLSDRHALAVGGVKALLLTDGLMSAGLGICVLGVITVIQRRHAAR